MSGFSNPFHNPYLSGDDVTENAFASKAKSVFHNRPLISQMPIQSIEHRLQDAREKLVAREKKAAALRELAGNLGACGFISPGNGGDAIDAAKRYEAEAAMVDYLQMVVEGMERLIAQKREQEGAR